MAVFFPDLPIGRLKKTPFWRPKTKSACISASISAIFWFSCWTCGWKRMDVRYTEIPTKSPSFIPGHPENVGKPWAKSPSFWVFVTSFYVTKVQLHPRGLHHVAVWSQKKWRRSKKNMSKLVTPMNQMANTWLVVYLPLWKIWVRQLWWLFPTEWKVIKFLFQSSPTRY